MLIACSSSGTDLWTSCEMQKCVWFCCALSVEKAVRSCVLHSVRRRTTRAMSPLGICGLLLRRKCLLLMFPQSDHGMLHWTPPPSCLCSTISLEEAGVCCNFWQLTLVSYSRQCHPQQPPAASIPLGKVRPTTNWPEGPEQIT